MDERPIPRELHSRVAAQEPDVVLIHHAANDVLPRLWPGFEEDYAHFHAQGNRQKAAFVADELTRQGYLP